MSGIFNPFKKPGKPKQDYVSSTDPKNPRDTEYTEMPKGSIRLDGDSYVLQINNVTLEELTLRLELLLQAVSNIHSKELQTAGVFFYSKPYKPTLQDDQLLLETPNGYIVIYAQLEESRKEVDCYRRLAYALYSLPIQNILVKHNAKVYKRG